MGRMTRKKAAEVAEQLHIDEDALLDVPSDDVALFKAKASTPEPNDRTPLGELAPNSADSTSHSDDAGQELKKSIRGKKGGKKARGKAKRNDLAASTMSQAADDPQDEVLADDDESAPSPASERAAEDLMKAVPELSISRVRDTRSRSPPSEAVKLTRSQLKEKKGKTVPEPKTLVDGLGQEQTMKEETVRDIPVIETSETGESALDNGTSETGLDAPASPLPNAVPNVISHLRAEMSAKRSTSNKENVEPLAMESPQPITYDTLEDAAVTAATPPRSERDSPVRPEDHISALDELVDAVETVSKDIPEVQTSPEKSKGKRDVSKKPAPVVRTTKAAAARISLAHNKDAAGKPPPALGRPSPSKALGRSSSVRQPSSSSNRAVSGTSVKDEQAHINGEKKEVVIPHSKPRPISLSFPTPPPPPKSRKAPTQSTFKLPGEAVAEKLKAAREARMQKEAEEQKKQPFRARPVPTSLSKAPSVRQTSSSKARESLMTGRDVKPVSSASGLGRDVRASLSAPGPAHKRANSVATTRPAGPKPRVTSTETLTPAMNSSVARLSAPRKRSSTAMADMSKPRASLAPSTGPSGLGRVPSGTTTGTAKGKEVFNRAAAAKAAANKEKSDKEEATKKARAEAAERSKQAAREWAEKQRRKQLAAKQAAQKNEEPTCVRTDPVSSEAGPAAVEA